MDLVGLAVAVLLATAVGALLAFRHPRVGTGLGAAGAVAAFALGIGPAWSALAGTPVATVSRPWPIPGGTLIVGLDPLSAFFLIPLLGLSALAAIYGHGYLAAYSARKRVVIPASFFNVFVASMVVVVIAREALTFLMAWEVMTLSSYALVVFEHEDPTVKRAGWVYLIAGHIGVACLLVMFLLLSKAGGHLDFASFPAEGGLLPTVIVVLALAGFGIKAGIVPLHVWLPEAHAAAPSHVSALMSGVLIKLGIYGILRVFTFLGPEVWWGTALMAMGLAGAVLGISLALYQRDLKRVLAYSSIENVGIILLGLGLGLWGAQSGHPGLAALGLLGGLLHVWNHTLMKGLMFFSAGSVLHGTGTKDLERLGGLMQRMPTTGALMLVGATAIAGLPLLNGFVGEWLMYLGLMGGARTGSGFGAIAFVLAVGGLAFVGGLAALCFVRLVGVALLGQPRSASAEQAHESSAWMIAPMVLLAVACWSVAVSPMLVLRLLGPVATQIGGPLLGTAVEWVGGPASTVGMFAAAAWALVLTIGLLLFARSRGAAQDQTWGCGYPAPTARMQYTASSFSELMAEGLMPAALRARISVNPPRLLFPSPSRFATDTADPVTRGVYEPFLLRWGDRFARLRWVQQGVLQLYLLYILVAALVALGWVSL